jgi:hypothetical protein
MRPNPRHREITRSVVAAADIAAAVVVEIDAVAADSVAVTAADTIDVVAETGIKLGKKSTKKTKKLCSDAGLFCGYSGESPVTYGSCRGIYSRQYSRHHQPWY